MKLPKFKDYWKMLDAKDKKDKAFQLYLENNKLSRIMLVISYICLIFIALLQTSEVAILILIAFVAVMLASQLYLSLTGSIAGK